MSVRAPSSSSSLGDRSHLGGSPWGLVRKTRLKFLVRRWIGEPYVGKRMKMRHLARILRRVAVPPSPRVLEVGCEDGTFTEWLSRRWRGAVVDGLELDPEQAAACSRWAGQVGRAGSLRFRLGDVLDLAAVDEYDLIACLDVLGYIPDDREAIRRMARALRPGGRLLIHQPNTTYRTFFGEDRYVPPEEAGRVTEGHVRHGYSPDELRALVESDPTLRLVAIHPLNGRLSDVAHRVYSLLERPAPLRLLTLPIVDGLSALDRLRRPAHGNTLCAIARKVGQEAAVEVP